MSSLGLKLHPSVRDKVLEPKRNLRVDPRAIVKVTLGFIPSYVNYQKRVYDQHELDCQQLEPARVPIGSTTKSKKITTTTKGNNHKKNDKGLVASKSASSESQRVSQEKNMPVMTPSATGDRVPVIKKASSAPAPATTTKGRKKKKKELKKASSSSSSLDSVELARQAENHQGQQQSQEDDRIAVVTSPAILNDSISVVTPPAISSDRSQQLSSAQSLPGAESSEVSEEEEESSTTTFWPNPLDTVVTDMDTVTDLDTVTSGISSSAGWYGWSSSSYFRNLAACRDIDIDDTSASGISSAFDGYSSSFYRSGGLSAATSVAESDLAYQYTTDGYAIGNGGSTSVAESDLAYQYSTDIYAAIGNGGSTSVDKDDEDCSETATEDVDWMEEFSNAVLRATGVMGKAAYVLATGADVPPQGGNIRKSGSGGGGAAAVTGAGWYMKPEVDGTALFDECSQSGGSYNSQSAGSHRSKKTREVK